MIHLNNFTIFFNAIIKKTKFGIILSALLLLTAIIIINISRLPSYTIQTNGKLYIVNKLSSNVTVFDLFLGKKVAEIPISILPHEATTLSNQNKVVLTNYGDTDVIGKSLSIINTESNSIEKTIDLDKSLRPHGIVSFPKSNKVGVVTNVGNNLLVINIETGVIEKLIPTKQIVSQLLVLHPDKPLAYVTNINSNSVSVIDLVKGKVIKTISCGNGTEGIDITPDGKEIWVTNSKENTISIISTKTNRITTTLKTGNQTLRLKFSIDGNYCLSTSAGDGTISVYDRYLKKQINTIQLPGKKGLIQRALYHTPHPVGILMHPNGLYAFVANSNANKIEVIDLKTFSLVSTIETGKVPDGIAFVE